MCSNNSYSSIKEVLRECFNGATKRNFGPLVKNHLWAPPLFNPTNFPACTITFLALKHWKGIYIYIYIYIYTGFNWIVIYRIPDIPDSSNLNIRVSLQLKFKQTMYICVSIVLNKTGTSLVVYKWRLDLSNQSNMI